eukprot:COSAG02_NODE_52798_length_305_cov_1.699029_1_plen_53_part_01
MYVPYVCTVRLYSTYSGSPPSHAFAEIEAQHSTKIEGSLPFLHHEVEQTVKNM